MQFTCIICEFKFDECDFDADERMCIECLDASLEDYNAIRE